MLGARRAVQADDIGAQPLENRQARAHISAEQHASIRVQRDLDLQRQATAGFGKTAPNPEHHGLCLEDVLLGLDDE